MRIVPGFGPPNARLMLVGEAPGADEERDGVPFVGAAGRMLNAMLAAAGIHRERCYVTNVVKVRPPNNTWEHLGHLINPNGTQVTVTQFLPELEREIREVNPYVIVALGDKPLQYLTGRTGITKWRGSVLPNTLVPDGPKVIPTLHPAYIMRDYTMHPVGIMDLMRAKRESTRRTLPLYEPHLILSPTLPAVLEYIQRCHDTCTVSFDIETLGPRIRCLGLACDTHSAICIPFKRGPVNVWDASQEEIIWSAMRRLFADPHVLKIAQNAQFDLAHLVPETGFPAAPLFDTLLAHHLVAPELPHDLDFLTSVYTDIGYYGIGNVTRATDQDTWVYNCRDVLATLISARELQAELAERNLVNFYTAYVMPLMTCLYEMQHRGVLINTDKRQRLIDQLVSETDALTQRLYAETGEKLNPNSPKQLQTFFYTRTNTAPIINRKSGAPTVNRDALLKLSRGGSSVADTILEIRARQKLVSTFLNVPLAPDGRMHCEYVVSGTISGRLSSRAPYSGFGTNLQNIPPAARETFVPAVGMCFVKGDHSQAENRVVAWITCGSMKDAFKRGDDVHSLTASMLFGGSSCAHPKGSRTREIAKRINHAANYGMGPLQMSILLGVPQKEAKLLLERYHTVYPEVREGFHIPIQQQLQRDRTLITPHGRVHQFLGRWGDELFRSAYSFIPQAVVADTLNMGLVDLWLALKEQPYIAYPVLQVHDEVVVECQVEHAEAVRQLMHKHLERPVVINNDTLIIPVETRILYTNWLF